MLYIGKDLPTEVYFENQNVSEIFLGNDRIYPNGANVVYHVDTSDVITIYADYGANVVNAPFVPAKSDWIFVGWKQDKTADASVLASLTMGTEQIDLYAVFRQVISVNVYNGSTAATKLSGDKYYNNGTIVNPAITIPTQASLVGWAGRGYSTSTAGNGDILCGAGARQFDAAATLYGMYQQTVTLTYYNGNGSAASTSGTRFRNSGTEAYVNPAFTISPATLSGYSFIGWATSSDAAGGINYNSIKDTQFAASTTVYARHQATVTLTYYATSTTAQSTNGTINRNNNNYAYPTFTIANPSIGEWTFIGWRTDATASSSVSYSSISSTQFTSNATIAAVFQQTIILSYDAYGGSGIVNAQTGNRYYNVRGNYANPSFVLAGGGALTRKNYTFSAWATGSPGGSQVNAGTKVTLTTSTIYYAVWIRVSKPFSVVVGRVMQSGYHLEVTTTTGGGEIKTIHSGQDSTITWESEYDEEGLNRSGYTNSIPTQGNQYMYITAVKSDRPDDNSLIVRETGDQCISDSNSKEIKVDVGNFDNISFNVHLDKNPYTESWITIYTLRFS